MENNTKQINLSDKLEIANEILDDSYNTFESKTNDYGVNTYDRIRSFVGPSYCHNRLLEKLFRVINLTDGNVEKRVNESIEDSYRDIIGYCLCELVYRKMSEEC